MKLGDIRSLREVFDQVDRAILARRREAVLRHLGPATIGLLVWHFGAGGESRDPREIPMAKIQEFVNKYA